MIDFSNYKYCPILCVRPAEMVALEELPEKDKDKMLPIILCRPWVNSKQLKNTFDKISDAIGDRFWIADIDNLYERGTSAEREVHRELDELKVSDFGYLNWCEKIKSIPQAIPTLQLEDPDELEEQIDYFLNLGRGIVVRFTPNTISRVTQILSVISSKQVQNLCVILDYEHISFGPRRDVNEHAAQVLGVLSQVEAITPAAKAIVSATSFPSSFKDLENQTIYERALYNTLQQAAIMPLIYSDRGSARAERLGGGGGDAIPPRIDYPDREAWYFVRKENEEKMAGYRNAAKDIMRAAYWNSDLDIWGTNMIKAAAGGDSSAIKSPARSSAVRINIHLHQQLFYDNPDELLDTDDEWKDI